MKCEDFRSEMIAQIRAFDQWAYKDVMQNPDDYIGYEFEDWFDMFKEYLNND